MGTTKPNGKTKGRRREGRARPLTKWEAATAAAQWVDVIRSTLAALVASVNNTRHEANVTPDTLGAALDVDELRQLANMLQNAECMAHGLQYGNPLDVVVPSALALFGAKKGGAA